MRVRRSQAPAAQEAHLLQRFFKTQLCFEWQHGACKAGDRCTYAHGDHELRALVRPEPEAAKPAPVPKRARSEERAPAGRCVSRYSAVLLARGVQRATMSCVRWSGQDLKPQSLRLRLRVLLRTTGLALRSELQLAGAAFFFSRRSR